MSRRAAHHRLSFLKFLNGLGATVESLDGHVSQNFFAGKIHGITSNIPREIHQLDQFNTPAQVAVSSSCPGGIVRSLNGHSVQNPCAGVINGITIDIHRENEVRSLTNAGWFKVRATAEGASRDRFSVTPAQLVTLI
jgi:hypothetical protein